MMFLPNIAKHCVDVGCIIKLKIKLTPEHPLPVYVQGPTAPIHLREEISFELALLQYFNIVKTLSHSKYNILKFFPRRSSRKLRVFIDLRRVEHTLHQDCLNSNFPSSDTTDATNHFARIKLYCELD